MDIDTTKHSIFEINRKYFINALIITTILAVCFTYIISLASTKTAENVPVGLVYFMWSPVAAFWATVLYCSFIIFWTINDPLSITPDGIIYPKYFSGIALWEDLKAIETKKPFRSPEFLCFTLRDQQTTKQKPRVKFSRRILHITEDFCINSDHFVGGEELNKIVEAYAREYGRDDLFLKL